MVVLRVRQVDLAVEDVHDTPARIALLEDDVAVFELLLLDLVQHFFDRLFWHVFEELDAPDCVLELPLKFVLVLL